ncbi:hypothetical protein [Reichenbachiella sp.]
MKNYIKPSHFKNLVIDGFSIYLKNFWKLLTVSFVLLLPFYVLDEIIYYLYPAILDTPYQWASLLFMLIPQYFTLFALVGAISDYCLGNPISVRKTILRVSSRGVGRLLFTELILVLYAYLWLTIPVVIAIFVLESEIALGLSFLIGIIGFGWILLKHTFLNQVVIIERLYFINAFERTKSITNRNIWKVISTILLFLIVIWIPAFALGAFPTFLYEEEGTLFSLGAGLWNSLISTQVIVIGACFNTLFYYSFRIENQDLSQGDLFQIKSYESF